MVGERGDKQQPAPAVPERCGLAGRQLGSSVAAGVGDLDAEVLGGRSVGERQTEVAAGNAAVNHGIRGEFGHDEFGTLREVGRCVPGLQLGHGEEAGEAGAARCGRQEL